MKKILFLISLFIAGTLAANLPGEKTASPVSGTLNAPAMTISLTGSVLDKETGESLAGARIQIIETGDEIFTDILGNFTIAAPASGAYTLKVSYISYQEQELTCKPEKNVEERVISLLPL